MKIFTAIFILFYLHQISGKECQHADTCGDCLNLKCSWCLDDEFKENRCFDKNTKSSCNNIYEHKIQPVFVKTKNLPLSSRTSISPQQINANAYVGSAIEFSMSYKSNDYPLDIYLVVDKSWTMRVTYDKVINSIHTIREELEKITKNVKIGAGAFIDKNAIPYTRYNNINSGTFNFKNIYKITDDIESLVSTLENDKNFYGNNDDPEDCLGAVMQAMTCTDEIGWRADSRKIIVVFTDGEYHSAGDGIAVTAYRQNDMKCHLHDNMNLKFDYPSVSQINSMSIEKGISLIFAVPDKLKIIYEKLAGALRNAVYQQMNNDIASFIKNQYQKIISKLQMTYEVPEFMKLTVDPDCFTKPCNYTQGNNTMSFKGTITIESCPTDLKFAQVKITPALPDTLTINVDLYCTCNCENEYTLKGKSKKCNNAGYDVCGKCKCDENRFGNDCTCLEPIENYKDCTGSDNKICSDLGSCECGKCQCNPSYMGKFCEINSIDLCPKINKKICAENGQCVDGKCSCYPGWTGDDCNCPLNEGDCIAPGDDKVCNGRGDCKCGQCSCYSDVHNETLTIFCENSAKLCKKVGQFVDCTYFGDCSLDLKNTFPNFDIKNKPVVMEECTYDLRNGTASIEYFRSKDEIRIYVAKKQLPSELDYVPIIGGVIGGVIFTGLLAVFIWKIIMDIHDKNEYEKFVKETEKNEGVTSTNPHYESPTRIFCNPAYSKNAVEC